MRDYPEVGELASQARHRLAPFTGLHMTPPEWLHMTTHVAGPAGQFSDQQMQHMTAVASDYLAGVPPVTVSLGKILYHSEAIMLAVTPVGDLTPIRAAALAATNAVISRRTTTSQTGRHISRSATAQPTRSPSRSSSPSAGNCPSAGSTSTP
jgi:hypothetical protein